MLFYSLFFRKSPAPRENRFAAILNQKKPSPSLDSNPVCWDSMPLVYRLGHYRSSTTALVRLGFLLFEISQAAIFFWRSSRKLISNAAPKSDFKISPQTFFAAAAYERYLSKFLSFYLKPTRSWNGSSGSNIGAIKLQWGLNS